MRLIALLIALLLIGLLVQKQLNPTGEQSSAPAAVVAPDTLAPRVSNNPNELPQFQAQMNDFMQAEADKRADAIDAATAQ